MQDNVTKNEKVNAAVDEYIEKIEKTDLACFKIAPVVLDNKIRTVLHSSDMEPLYPKSNPYYFNHTHAAMAPALLYLLNPCSRTFEIINPSEQEAHKAAPPTGRED